MFSTATVSLEPHLAQSLRPLLAILPADISNLLASELESTEIPYSVLTQVSRWARTDEGQARLRAAGLNPREYDNSVSLLAGTRTSPSSKLPPGAPLGSESTEVRVRRELNDRKALVAVVNGLLSVGCAGGAVWWAADKSGWRDEWKVLCALMAATVVGVSETILFMIWSSRLSSSFNNGSVRRQRVLAPKEITSDKKSDDNGADVEPKATGSTYGMCSSPAKSDHRLRQRTARNMNMDG